MIHARSLSHPRLPANDTTAPDDKTGGEIVLVAVESKGNRQEIENVVASQYHTVDTDECFAGSGDFDLAIVDGPGLRKWYSQLTEARMRARPVFQPILLLSPRNHLCNRVSELAGLVDDFVIVPIDRIVFGERIRMLLRARQQSVEQRDELFRIVNYDWATGLPNRPFLLDRVASSLSAADPHSNDQALLFAVRIPLWNSTEVLGERATGEVARLCSQHLRALIDDHATLARLSADRWAVWLPIGSTTEQAIALCSRIDQLRNRPVDAGGETFYLAPRIGVGVYPDDAVEAEPLLDAAITASGHAAVGDPVFYAMEHRDSALHYLRTEVGLRQALEREEFELWLQPKISLENGSMTSTEALIRWREPSGKLVSPGEFIPVAETSGFIRHITRWMLEKAVRTIAEWRLSGEPELRIAINISAADVAEQTFASWLRGQCSEHDVSPGEIELELTETMVCEMDDQTMHNLRDLRDAGFSIAVDDFGTGYSSLWYLHELPIDTLKVDKCFIDTVPGDSGRAVVTDAIIDLAQAFGLTVVAEGIEEKEQMEYLRNAKVEYGQGFYIARPMPLEQFREWVSTCGLTPCNQAARDMNA